MSIPFLAHGFESAAERLLIESAEREGLNEKLLSYGVTFLDRVMRGIFPDDLVLVGAPSGVGKTQFCVNTAIANAVNGKRVHFFALEASKYEIERRIKYNLYAKLYFADPNRPYLDHGMNYLDWYLNRYKSELSRYDRQVAEEFYRFQNLHTYYKEKAFGVNELVENLMGLADETDLIIVDHLHYMDLESDNENRAIKEIMVAARDVSLLINKPVILVAHLRKRDRKFAELVPGIDEFHGSSDLSKIATVCVTLGRGAMINPTKIESFIRVNKFRKDGSTTYYVGRLVYLVAEQKFDEQFQIGKLVENGTFFEQIPPAELPMFLRGSGS